MDAFARGKIERCLHGLPHSTSRGRNVCTYQKDRDSCTLLGKGNLYIELRIEEATMCGLVIEIKPLGVSKTVPVIVLRVMKHR